MTKADGLCPRLKTVLRMIGIGVAALGGMFLPIGYGVNPKRDTSFFNNVADFPAFLTWAGVLLGAGLTMVVVAVLLPGKFDDGD